MVSRPRLMGFACALVLGALTAAWPALFGEPPAEWPELRGLAAFAFALPMALGLAARWGRQGPLPLATHARELTALSLLEASLLLPSTLAGISLAEVRALSAMLQAGAGWSVPLRLEVAGLALLAAAYFAARLWGSHARHPLAGRRLLGIAATVAALAIVTSALRFATIPALRGLEALEKWSLLALLLTLGSAALVRRDAAGPRPDTRTTLLLAGLSLASGFAFQFTNWYLDPPFTAIGQVRQIEGSSRGTTLAASLDHRPDLYGLFTMENASTPVRLAFVRPVEPYVDGLIEKYHSTRFGIAYLIPRPEAPWQMFPNERASQPPFVRARVRSSRWPHFVLPTGIRIATPVRDWAISGDGLLVVTSTYDQPPGRRRYIEDFGDTATYAVKVWRVGGSPRTLLDHLPSPPQIVSISGNSVSLLRATTRLGGFSGNTSWIAETCRLPAGPCESVAAKHGPWFPYDKLGDRFLFANRGSWIVIESRTEQRVFEVPRCKDCSLHDASALLLRNGGLVECSLRGQMPDWESRLSAFDERGKLVHETSLGNVRLSRLAGELEDGSVAFVWRKDYGTRRWQTPVPGWTLDAWDPRTGARRRLAEDLSTFPAWEGDTSPIFLDRDGRLVTPSSSGLRVLVDRR